MLATLRQLLAAILERLVLIHVASSLPPVRPMAA